MIIWFKKYVSDVKSRQNLGKLSFSMTFVGFYKTFIEISYKNNPKRSKMIKNGPKWFKNDLIYVIMCFKKWISDLRFHQTLVKYRFLMIFIDFYKTLIKISSKNDPKRSKTVQNAPKCGFWIIFRSCARNVHWLPSESLHKVHVRSFMTPP